MKQNYGFLSEEIKNQLYIIKPAGDENYHYSAHSLSSFIILLGCHQSNRSTWYSTSSAEL